MFLLIMVLSLFVFTFSFAQATGDDPSGGAGGGNSRIIPEEDLDQSVIWDGSGYSVKIFTLTDNYVTTLRTSNAIGKSFTLREKPAIAKRILCVATLDHSLRSDEMSGRLNDVAIYGVCEFVYFPVIGSWQYDAVASYGYTFSELGTRTQFSFGISDYLEDGVEYFTYIKNRYPAGYVFGSMTAYWIE
jgi:hypothetical protein